MKKGFTLVELLVVIVIIGLLVVIAVPSGLAISKKIKQNMMDNKIELIESGAIVWGQQTQSKIKNHNYSEDCTKNISTDITACVRKTIEQLLNEENALEEDGVEEDGTKYLKNPTTDKSINNCEIEIYIKNKRVYADYNVSESKDCGGTGTILDNAEEGTLLAAIKRDNIVSEPLTVPGKVPSGVKFAEGETNVSASSTMGGVSSYADSYWVYGTGYEFDDESGTYYLTGVSVTSDIYSNSYSELEGNFIVSNRASDNVVSSFENIEMITTTGMVSLYQVAETTSSSLTYYTSSPTKTTIDEALLASTEDDYGISYYYRGSVENNYVNFSGMCWRIVRVQGDGAIKLTLADENSECDADTYSTTDTNGAFINGAAVYNVDDFSNSSYNYEEHSGYTSLDLNILDSWLVEKNVETSKLTEGEWCFDNTVRQVSYYIDSNYNITYDRNLGTFEDYDYYYASYDRLVNRKTAQPTLKCTTSEKINNYIGMLTVDELAFAGQAYQTYYGNSFLRSYGWTLSPAYWWTYSDWIAYWMSGLSGGMYDSAPIRPVVILKQDVEATTNSDTTTYGKPGTYTNPYVVS